MLPSFGYHLESGGDVLSLRRPDGSLVAAFDAEAADAFEVEAAVRKDA